MILCEYMHLDTTRIPLIPYWCISYLVSHRIVLIKYLVVSHLIPICVSLLIVKNRKISLIVSHCSTWMEKTKNKSIIISRHIVSKISKKKPLTILRLDHNLKKKTSVPHNTYAIGVSTLYIISIFSNNKHFRPKFVAILFVSIWRFPISNVTIYMCFTQFIQTSILTLCMYPIRNKLFMEIYRTR